MAIREPRTERSSMVTGETITDEQVSDLMHEVAQEGGNRDLVKTCSRALFQPDSKVRQHCRQLAADAWNARHGGE